MNIIRSIASGIFPWFVICALVYTYLNIDSNAFTSLDLISYFYLSIFFVYLANVEELVSKGSVSFTFYKWSANTFLAQSVFCIISLYVWVNSEMSYTEIMIRSVATVFQYFMVYYSAVLVTSIMDRKYFIFILLAVFLYMSQIKDPNSEYFFVIIIANLFYLPVLLFSKGYYTITAATFFGQVIFLIYLKYLVEFRVKALYENGHYICR